MQFGIPFGFGPGSNGTRFDTEVYWVDIRDMLVDGLANGGIHRLLFHSVSNVCKHEARQLPFIHSKSCSSSCSFGGQEVGFEHRNSAFAVGFEHRMVDADLEDFVDQF